MTFFGFDLFDDLRLRFNPHIERCFALVLWEAAKLVILAEKRPVVDADALDVGEL